MLSSRGYRIPLEGSAKHMKKLTIYSEVQSDYPGPKPKVVCYRTSDKYLYVPRYYGIENIGKPSLRAKESIEDIDVLFNGTLRPYQEEVIEKTLENFKKGPKGGVWSIGTGRGKCLGYDTPVIMYDGTIKMVQDVKVGDQLMGDDSTPRTVLSLARGKEEMYEIKPTKGESFIVNKSHILSLRCTSTVKGPNNWVSKKYVKDKIVDISVEEYQKQSEKFKHHFKGYRVPIDFEYKDIPLDPYIIGIWLGDGSSNGGCISNQDSTILKYLVNKLPQYNCYLQYTGQQYDYRINGDFKSKVNYFHKTLKSLNLINNKHIPYIYKCNNRENRLKLLAGLLDSDGSNSDNCFDFTQKSEKLMNDVIYLSRSLGFSAYKSIKKTSWTYKGIKKYGTAFRCCISGEGIDKIPCKVPRKKAISRKQIKNVLNYGFEVIPKGIDDYYGFEIDGNRRFVLGDFTVTHNTVLALKMITTMNVKTIIIVHKQVLLDQWKERIEQFIPSAKVGLIQGPTIDVEGKDIVLAMVQSLTRKEYPRGLFACFGMMIVDELHCICSQTFSEALFMIQTRYRLGLSATPKRKDGFDKVFLYHMGPTIVELHSNLIEPEIKFFFSPVLKGIEVVNNNFGKVNLPKLITDIANNEERNDYIITIIKEVMKEDRKMLVFSDRLKQCKTLNFLFKRVITDKTCDTFIGEKKKEELKKALEADVIFATYGICKEGFDCPSLDTLLFATPKSDVIQAVGRILRRKNKFHPVVIDIVDKQFGTLKGQYYKRKQYYNKKQYKQTQTIKHEQSDKKPKKCLIRNVY